MLRAKSRSAWENLPRRSLPVPLELGVSSESVVVVGDDLESDVLGAMDQGLKGVLVRTGKFSQCLLNESDRKPDAVIDSIADLSDLLN